MQAFESPANDVVVPRNLISEYDYFQWSCISGEKYPPAFTGGAGYTAFDAYPVVQAIAGAGNPSVTWPFLPRTGPAQTATGAVEFTIRMERNNFTSNPAIWPALYLASSVNLQISVSPSLGTYMELLTTAGGSGAGAVAIPSMSDLVKVQITPTAITWSVNGIAKPPPPMDVNVNNHQPLHPRILSNNGAGNTLGLNVGLLRVEWLQP